MFFAGVRDAFKLMQEHGSKLKHFSFFVTVRVCRIYAAGRISKFDTVDHGLIIWFPSSCKQPLFVNIAFSAKNV